MVIYERLKVESSQFWLDFSVASLVSVMLSNQSCDTWFRHHCTQWWLNDWPWSKLCGGSLHLLPSPVPVTLRRHLCQYWERLISKLMILCKASPTKRNYLPSSEMKTPTGTIAPLHVQSKWPKGQFLLFNFFGLWGMTYLWCYDQGSFSSWTQ